jgi:hypothetical protein
MEKSTETTNFGSKIIVIFSSFINKEEKKPHKNQLWDNYLENYSINSVKTDHGVVHKGY